MAEIINKLKSIKQEPKEYVSVRIIFTYVKYHSFFGFRDKEISRMVCIPNEASDILEIHKKIQELIKDYGVQWEPPRE